MSEEQSRAGLRFAGAGGAKARANAEFWAHMFQQGCPICFCSEKIGLGQFKDKAKRTPQLFWEPYSDAYC